MNDTTPHYKLPLPHPGNEGAEDCLALRLALQALDAELHAASEQAAALMQGHAGDANAHGLTQRLDALNAELQGSVDALRATLQGDLAAGLAGKADSTAMQDALALKADAATMAAELAKKSNAATVTAALATKTDKAENATEHEALRGEIDAAHAKAQEALERDPLPSMTGAANKFLSTDGTQACWKTLETLAVVSPPTVEMAAQFPIGFASTVRMSAASRLTDGHVASFFVVAGGAQPVSVPALNNAASHDLSIDGEAGQLVPVKVVAVDNNGYQSEAVTHNVALVDVTVAAPVLSGVVEGAVDVGLRPTVSVGPFVVSLAGFDAPRAADNVWYCFKAAGGAVIEQGHKTFAASGGDITPAENLPLLADVTLEVKWLGNKLEGAKAALGFCTLDAKVLPPSIVSPVNGATGVPLTPTFELSAFSNVGPVDTPAGTRIRVYADAAGTQVVAQYDGPYVTSWTPSAPLPLDSEHWAEAWHRGVLWGWSAAGVRVGFGTLAASIETPVILQPSVGYIRKRNLEIVVSLSKAIGCAHDLTDWKMTSDQAGLHIIESAMDSRNKFAHAFSRDNSLAAGSDVYFFARFKDSASKVVSSWSLAVRATVIDISFMACGNQGTVASMNVAKIWTSGRSVGRSPTIHGITYAKERFVACGSSSEQYKKGEIFLSYDGLTWEFVTNSVGGQTWFDVCFGKGIFVIVSDSITATSDDGYTWEDTITTEAQIRSVCYGNGKFVGVGHSSIWASDDGKTWQKVHTTTLELGSFADVIFANGKFVAVGTAYASGYSCVLTVTSLDGHTWTNERITSKSSTHAGGKSIAYGKGKYVVIAGTGLYTSSVDGVAWASPASMGTGDLAWESIVFDEIFVAAGCYGKPGHTTFSSDGITWDAPKPIGNFPYAVLGLTS